MNTLLLDQETVTPSKVVCIGRNYVEHIRELNNEIPDDMVIFVKPNSAIAANLKAFDQEPLHYEGEICFMVRNKQLGGIGFGLDITKRQLQSRLKSKGLPWERAKAFNGAAVFSPFVSIEDSQANYAVELSINNKLAQQGFAELMMNKPDQILAEILSFMDLNDGDIIMTGTPKGVGQINPGDEFNGRISLNGSTLVDASWRAG